VERIRVRESDFGKALTARIWRDAEGQANSVNEPDVAFEKTDTTAENLKHVDPKEICKWPSKST
jgi:hypothetical protein